MAIVLPLLLLMLFGIIEFGRILGAYMIIHELTRDGVRAGVVGSTEDEIKNYIKDNESIIMLDKDNDISVDPADSSRVVGDQLKVAIDYDIDIITPIISSIVPNPMELSAEYVMRIEKLP